MGKVRNCLDAHLGQIVCDKYVVVNWCTVLVEMPVSLFELPKNLNIVTQTPNLNPLGN